MFKKYVYKVTITDSQNWFTTMAARQIDQLSEPLMTQIHGAILASQVQVELTHVGGDIIMFVWTYV